MCRETGYVSGRSSETALSPASLAHTRLPWNQVRHRTDFDPICRQSVRKCMTLLFEYTRYERLGDSDRQNVAAHADTHGSGITVTHPVVMFFPLPSCFRALERVDRRIGISLLL